MSTVVNVVHSLGYLSVFALLTMAVAIVAFGLAAAWMLMAVGMLRRSAVS